MNPTAMIPGAIAFVVVVLLVPIIVRLCAKWRLLDVPGPLKIHSRPTPRLGGIAIALAILAAAFISKPHLAVREWHFWAALGLVWTTGLVDDLRGLSPFFRLAAQIAAGTLMWLSGLHIPMLGVGFLDLIGVCVFVAGFVNAANFIDGADGLAAGVTGIAALAYAILPGAATSSFSSVLAWSLAGACAAFLLFNFPPAKIFLGDAGSTSLGAGLAFLGLNFYRSGFSPAPRLFFPLMVVALPLLDAALAVIRRVRNGGSPLYGDRRHICDLLLARGWPPRSVALASYGISAALASMAWLSLMGESPLFWLLPAFSLMALLLAAIRLGSLKKGAGDFRGQQASAQLEKS